MNFKSIFIILILSIFFNCNRKKSIVENISEKEKFDIFYENFTTDFVFQISRIIFPLEGEYVDYDNIGLDENEHEIPTKYFNLWLVL